jgi:hypothetical protein
LIQTGCVAIANYLIAVLEQPSPRHDLDQTLGRRNIVLPETGELNRTDPSDVLYPTAVTEES